MGGLREVLRSAVLVFEASQPRHQTCEPSSL